MWQRDLSFATVPHLRRKPLTVPSEAFDVDRPVIIYA